MSTDVASTYMRLTCGQAWKKTEAFLAADFDTSGKELGTFRNNFGFSQKIFPWDLKYFHEIEKNPTFFL